MAITTRALVTGGAGFIGSNLANELIRQGAKVRIIDNLVTGNRHNLEEIAGDFDFIEGDLNDGLVGEIQRARLVPQFKQGNYSQGIYDTIQTYVATLAEKRQESRRGAAWYRAIEAESLCNGSS